MTGTATVASTRQLCDQLAAMGLAPRRAVLVHASMRAVGPVDGGAAALLAALRRVVGRAAVVVPAQTAYNSTSSPEFRAATTGLTPTEVARHIDRIEAFDPAITPSRGMGVLAEQVRQSPAAVRSRHPQTSFAAVGHGAAELMRVHDLDCHLGDRSPLGALYDADATVLLLGVDHRVCTAYHLAEYRLPDRRSRPTAASSATATAGCGWTSPVSTSTTATSTGSVRRWSRYPSRWWSTAGSAAPSREACRYATLSTSRSAGWSGTAAPAAAGECWSFHVS
ncbi:hypothetical protein GCM10029963_04260 [Micromonospora andamanensis]